MERQHGRHPRRAGLFTAIPLSPRLLPAPRQRDPYDLKLSRSSANYDLSLLRAPIRGNIPVLPLEQEAKRTLPGQPVVVVGYPTGLEAILAKAESGVVRRILESHGTDSERVTLALSRQGLIRPSTTLSSWIKPSALM